MNDVIEVQKGIFEFKHPTEVNTEKWLSEHLDCDTIVDDLGNTIIVYAFTIEPKYNYALEKYKEIKKLDSQRILGRDFIRCT